MEQRHAYFHGSKKLTSMEGGFNKTSNMVPYIWK